MQNLRIVDPSPLAIEYSAQQIESARTHLEVFAKHSQDYMVGQGEWEMCTHSPTQSVLQSQLLSDPQTKDFLGVPITQPMVGQFGTFQTTMNEFDREVLHINDVKVIQTQISTNPKEKALHAAAANKVLQGQATIKNDPVAGAHSVVADLAAFNAKAHISADLLHVTEAQADLNNMEYPTQRLKKPDTPLRRGGRTSNMLQLPRLMLTPRLYMPVYIPSVRKP